MSFTNAHLLLTDPGTEPSDVATLIGNVRPTATRDRATGLLKLSRHTYLEGPLELTPDDLTELGITDLATVTFALWGPTDRETTPPPGDGPLDPYFPAGLPEREEARNLDLLLALARRLHGSVRLADEATATSATPAPQSTQPTQPRIITPNPDSHPVFTVYSSYWLDPGMCAQAVAAVAPQVTTHDELTSNLTHPVTPGNQVPLDEPIVLDGYSVTATLAAGPDYPAEVWVLLEDHLPAAVAQYAQPPLISYQVRWLTPEHVNAEVAPTQVPEPTNPGVPDPATRARTLVELENIVRQIMRVTAGIGVDADGFLVVESQLGDQ